MKAPSQGCECPIARKSWPHKASLQMKVQRHQGHRLLSLHSLWGGRSLSQPRHHHPGACRGHGARQLADCPPFSDKRALLIPGCRRAVSPVLASGTELLPGQVEMRQVVPHCGVHPSGWGRSQTWAGRESGQYRVWGVTVCPLSELSLPRTGRPQAVKS